jgi:hypothetical protein
MMKMVRQARRAAVASMLGERNSDALTGAMLTVTMAALLDRYAPTWSYEEM